MKVAIVGSRDFSRPVLITAYVQSLPTDTIVVSGGARGVDRIAEDAAKARGLKTEVFPADWETFGKRAGFLRNKRIVEAADQVTAFWDGKSRGTKMTIDLAEKAGKTVIIVTPERKPK